jgi:DNA-binding protein Fis
MNHHPFRSIKQIACQRVKSLKEKCVSPNEKITSGTRLGFIGLGYLGSCIARRLIAAGFSVTVYDRNQAKAAELYVRDLPERIRARAAETKTDDPNELLPLAEMERRYVLRVLEQVGGNKVQAAKILGINRATVYRIANEPDPGDEAPGHLAQTGENQSGPSTKASRRSDFHAVAVRRLTTPSLGEESA